MASPAESWSSLGTKPMVGTRIMGLGPGTKVPGMAWREMQPEADQLAWPQPVLTAIW